MTTSQKKIPRSCNFWGFSLCLKHNFFAQLHYTTNCQIICIRLVMISIAFARRMASNSYRLTSELTGISMSKKLPFYDLRFFGWLFWREIRTENHGFSIKSIRETDITFVIRWQCQRFQAGLRPVFFGSDVTYVQVKMTYVEISTFFPLCRSDLTLPKFFLGHFRPTQVKYDLC